LAVDVGVASNDPDSVPSVLRVDGTSRNNKRPRGVADGFQVSEHIVECQRDETSNVFTNDPSRSRECNNAAHLRPEVAVVFLRSLLSGDAEGLAGESAADEIDSSKPIQSVCVNAVNVVEAGDTWPMFSKHGSAVFVTFAECNGSHSGSLEAETESANTGEEVEDIHTPTLIIDAALTMPLRVRRSLV
jgi:hypothetical protein